MSEVSSRPVAVVTGGSRGIGRAIATELARTHQVVATYRTRRDAAERLREETGAAIFPAISHRPPTARRWWISRCKRWGGSTCW